MHKHTHNTHTLIHETGVPKMGQPFSHTLSLTHSLIRSTNALRVCVRACVCVCVCARARACVCTYHPHINAQNTNTTPTHLFMKQVFPRLANPTSARGLEVCGFPRASNPDTAPPLPATFSHLSQAPPPPTPSAARLPCFALVLLPLISEVAAL